MNEQTEIINANKEKTFPLEISMISCVCLPPVSKEKIFPDWMENCLVSGQKESTHKHDKPLCRYVQEKIGEWWEGAKENKTDGVTLNKIEQSDGMGYLG